MPSSTAAVAAAGVNQPLTVWLMAAVFPMWSALAGFPAPGRGDCTYAAGMLVSERIGQFFLEDDAGRDRLEYTEYGSGDRWVVLLHGQLMPRRMRMVDGGRLVEESESPTPALAGDAAARKAAGAAQDAGEARAAAAEAASATDDEGTS